TGPPGIGKSRLRFELLRQLAQRSDAPEVWIGRGDPVAAGSPLAILAQPIRRAAGILDGEPLHVRQYKLRARVARHVPAPDVQRVTGFLGELIGTTFSDDELPELRAARADPARLRDETSKAWQAWLSAECSARPVVVVIEDLNWGDRHTVRLVDAALRD